MAGYFLKGLVILHALSGVVTPQRISQTVNVGDDVTLYVITDIVNTRWRLDGSSEIKEWDEQKSVQRSNVQVSHGGIYECYKAGNRAEGRHAIFLLVVRACASGKWGLPACDNDCPLCFNGGICDERSGICVCAPGFTGINCETVHGSSRFGQDVSWHCGNSTPDPHSTACRGRLLCLPHPYGCSCFAGFHGIDCDQDCQQGTYGANCESECHCAEGVSCFPDTGECNDGQCKRDWFGVNCQYRCHCAEGVSCLPDTGCRDGRCHKDWYGFKCQERCPAFQTTTGLRGKKIPSMMAISVQWDPGPCSTAILSYQVFNNLQHCPDRQEHTTPELTSNRYEIRNLQMFSTYTINLEIIRNGETESNVHGTVSVTTDATVPQITPTFTPDPISTSDSLSFSWDAIPCISQGGPGLRYAFILSSNDGIIETDTTYDTTASFSDLDPCTIYTFEVHAVNQIGDGESSVSLAVTKPGPVNEFLVSQTSSPYELTVSLKMIEGQCIADGYIIRYTLINQDQCKEEIEETIQIETSDLMVVLNNLYPYSTYRVSISAVNSAGEGMETFMIQTTYIAEPSLAPSNISDSEVGLTMLSMQWMDPPCGSRHGALSYIYRLKNKADAVVMTGVTQSTSVTMTDLEPLTHYTFQVAAVTGAGSGPWSAVYDTTTKEIKAPAKLPDIEDGHITSTVFATVKIIIPQSTEVLVTDYQVGVQIKEMKPKMQMNDFGHYFDSKEAYVTAELSKNDVLQSPVFLVGDGEMYGKYYNAPLKANQTYTLHVANVVRINTTVFEAYWSEGTDVITPSSTFTCDSSKHSYTGSSSISAVATTIIAVLVTVIVILTLIIGIMSFILRAKNKQVKQQRQDPTNSTPLRALARNTGAPSQQIEMSLDGHVEYQPNSSENTSCQDNSEVDRPMGQEEDTYEEIPASTYATTIVCADDGEQEEDDVYTNDTVIKHRAPKLLPQYQPGE